MSELPSMLIIDDDSGIRETLVDIFNASGYEAVAASSGMAGIQMAERNVYNVALIDLRLPDIDGIEVLHALKSLAPEIICCIITGNASLQNAVETLRQGAVDYFVKPLVIEQVLHSLQASLEKQKMRRTLHDSEQKLQRNYEIQTVINSLLHISLKDVSLQDILQQILDHILSISWLAFEQRAAIFIVDQESGALEMIVKNGLPDSLQDHCRTVRKGQCYCGRAAATGHLQYAACVGEDHEVFCEGLMPHGHYCVPIKLSDTVLGVLNVYLMENHLRDQREEDFLTAIADTLAGIINRKQMENEKNALEAQLRQSQKMEAIGTMAGGIFHDFNNILTAILGYSNLALEGLENGEDVREDIKVVLQAGKRARDLVAQILAFSRKTEQEKVPVMLSLIVKEAVKLLRSSTPSSIEIKQHISAQGETVLGDPSRIHQVIMNLFTNASHAIRDRNGVITISLDQVDVVAGSGYPLKEIAAGSYMKLTVSDTGHGMDRQTMARIFEPYFTTKPINEGTGLGLSVVYGIVHDMGGVIHVDSKPGRGSVFDVYLPICDADMEKNSPVEPGQILNGTEKILFVDDEKSIASLGKRMLERFGYQVFTHTSVVEALEDFKSRPDTFDLAILDRIMPIMSGDDLAGELYGLRPDLPVILITGHSELAELQHDAVRSIRKLIMKPLVSAELLQVVRGVLDENK